MIAGRLFFILLLISLLQGCSGGEDMLDIPDPRFLEVLVEAGVDTNGDGQISREEALACTSLRLPSRNINSLDGLQAFENLDTLGTGVNPLSSLDLSGNPMLRFLECRGCELKELDLQYNPELRHLDCSGIEGLGNDIPALDLQNNPLLEILVCQGNLLESLDVSGLSGLKVLNCVRNSIRELDLAASTALQELRCNNNLLEELDLQYNTELTKMTSCGNILQNLDISRHSKLTLVGIDNMPGLDTVWVWTLPFPPEGVRVLMGYSPNITFQLPEYFW